MLACFSESCTRPLTLDSYFYLWFLAEPHLVIRDELGLSRSIHALPQKPMDTSDASGAEPSLAQQASVEISHCQVKQSYASNVGENVVENQIAVSALDVAVPSASFSDEPLAAPLPDRKIVFFFCISSPSFW